MITPINRINIVATVDKQRFDSMGDLIRQKYVLRIDDNAIMYVCKRPVFLITNYNAMLNLIYQIKEKF